MVKIALRPRRARIALASVATVAALLGTWLFPGAAQAASSYGTVGNYHSGKCLDDTNGSTSNGTQMQQWTCLYNSNQEWRIQNWVSYGGTTVYQIQNQKSTKCLDMWGGSPNNGTKVALYTCSTSDDAQLWYLVPTNINGWWDFLNVASKTCMTVSADSQSNGALIQGWSCATAGSDHSYFWEPHNWGPLVLCK